MVYNSMVRVPISRLHSVPIMVFKMFQLLIFGMVSLIFQVCVNSCLSYGVFMVIVLETQNLPYSDLANSHQDQIRMCRPCHRSDLAEGIPVPWHWLLQGLRDLPL